MRVWIHETISDYIIGNHTEELNNGVRGRSRKNAGSASNPERLSYLPRSARQAMTPNASETTSGS